MNTLRIGAGSAWWGDRLEPAKLNAERGRSRLPVLRDHGRGDDLGRAGAQAPRSRSFAGYDTYLDDRMQAVLPGCLKRGTKIISNQGWINPNGAAERIVHWLRELGAKGVKVAAVSGSLITDRVLELDRHDPGERQADRDARRTI